MKKLISSVLIFILMLCGTAFADEPINVEVNGKLIDFDVPPQIINGRTLVPMRAIFEHLGATVEWNDKTKTVTAVRENTTISLKIGDTDMIINGIPKLIDAPACIINGRTLVPIRAISDAFDLGVRWNKLTRTVSVNSYDDNIGKNPFDSLKYQLIKNGEYEPIENGERFSVVEVAADYSVAVSIDYNKKENDEYITLFLLSGDVEKDGSQVSLLFKLRKDENPGMRYGIEFDDGTEYAIGVIFESETGLHTEISNTFPKEMQSKAYGEMLFCMNLVDLTFRNYGFTLNDFGIHYMP